ncbi:telomerase Cajal body protein 1 homolog isoform X1 [Anthonomus grandis grandis]|uniref:telomerase Cajal body protein 1 homolog isoform X1 n=1 Tax=Anthonomus grandis grandis TaxID=2921223 RepID=UPI002164FF68|nr:telomerase Cajal body protein 1 homolog isoform X1 [Anthonomus grandis grandis]
MEMETVEQVETLDPEAYISATPFNYAIYNFDKTALELARAQWPNYADQHYLKGCKWSPDGTCLLTVVRGGGMNVFELPPDLYSCESLEHARTIVALNPAISVSESGLIYDYNWYPGMNSGNPATCCWISSGHQGPIHLWDAFTGDLRCSYRGYNAVDELESAMCVSFSADGQNVFCGYRKNVKIFATGRPGREYVEYPITHQASCLVASQAQPGVVAIGNVKNTIELVSQSDGTFRSLCKLQGHKGGITSMAFSYDGFRLYSGARKDKELICWDLRVPGRPMFILTRECTTNQKIDIDLSMDNKWLVSGGSDGKVQIWNVTETHYPSVHMQMQLHSDSCNGVSLHPYKPILATSSGQHHAIDPLHHTRQTHSYENALCMWWVGPQQEEPDLFTTIVKAATNASV